MCGIVGVHSASEEAHRAVAGALAALHHRGPDDEGRWREGNVSLGMRRLSVIDVAGGHQPIANEDGTVQVVLNGEIYNYRELAEGLRVRGHQLRTHSDTEVLVHLYEEEGPAMLAQLRGMFAFALWDGRTRTLLLARDRFGKKPLYYTFDHRWGLLFASELKALRRLVRAAGGELRVRDQAVYDYLSLGAVPQPDTIYDGVHAVPPGHFVQLAGDAARAERYWSLDFEPKRQVRREEAVEQVRALVAESVRLRLRSDVPLGLFLSGGLDSSVVAYEAARQVGAQLQTFTVSSPDPDLDESRVAGLTARALGIRHTVLSPTVHPAEELQFIAHHYDQPFADPSAIPSLAVSREARKHVTVVLNGDGGDEIFGGYRRHVASYALDLAPAVAISAARFAAGPLLGATLVRRSLAGFAVRFLRGVGTTPAERYLIWTTDTLRDQDKRPVWRAGPVRPTEERISAVIDGQRTMLDAQLATDIQLNLLSALLVKMDMATMAASIEARSPLMDHLLAEYVARLPASVRLPRGRAKGLLRSAYEGVLPSEVIHGKKRGFEIPLRALMANELRPLLMETVAAPGARVESYLDRSVVRSIAEQKGWPDRNGPLMAYTVLVLELWLRSQKGEAR